MTVREILARNILSKSAIFEYTLNAYVGCQHNCIYCYAKFMKRFTGHREPWGEFVDVKMNAPELLEREIARKKPGQVWISGVCDAYQPLERTYRVTRRCIEVLVRHGWPFTVQTKSPLVLRDIDLFKQAKGCEVGFTITTADDRVRKLFEPGAPPVGKRIEALHVLHGEGIRSFVMIAPILPGTEELIEKLKGGVDSVLIDRMNYHNADWVYRKYGLQDAMTSEFFSEKGEKLEAACRKVGIPSERFF